MNNLNRQSFFIILIYNFFRTLQCREIMNQTLKSSDLFPSWGMWGTPVYCSPGTYVIGYNIKHQIFQGSAGDSFSRNFFFRVFTSVYDSLSKNRDDKGLTGVELICASDWTTRASQMNIQSLSGSVGNWHKEEKYCPKGFANGFKVKVQPRQGWADDTGITNFKLLCDGDHLPAHDLSFQPGEWDTETTKCPHNTFLCGFKVKVEEDHTNDDTGLNAVEGYCCSPLLVQRNDKVDMTNEADTCEPKLSFQKVFEVDNSERRFIKRYFYQLLIGIEDTDKTSSPKINVGAVKDENPVMNVENVDVGGFEMHSVIAVLRRRLEGKLNWMKSTDFEELPDSSNLWSNLKEVSKLVDVPQGSITRVYEEVVDCGRYRIWSGIVKIVNHNSILHNDLTIALDFPISHTSKPRIWFPSWDNR